MIHHSNAETIGEMQEIMVERPVVDTLYRPCWEDCILWWEFIERFLSKNDITEFVLYNDHSRRTGEVWIEMS